MKKIGIIMLGLFVFTGCSAIELRRQQKEDKKSIIKSCIMEFINEDVKVKDAKEICNDIYRRIKQ